jgi:hypothetical protein
MFSNFRSSDIRLYKILEKLFLSCKARFKTESKLHFSIPVYHLLRQLKSGEQTEYVKIL